jgi:hypothetical protein
MLTATFSMVDSFGQIGNSAVFAQYGTWRKKSCGLRDVNTGDVFVPSVEYESFPVDDFSGLGACPSICLSEAPTASPTGSVSTPTQAPTAAPTASPTAAGVVVSSHMDPFLSWCPCS